MKKVLLTILLGIFSSTACFSFHTEPSRWKEPRIYQSSPDARNKNRISIKKSDWPPVLTEPVHSPNKAYFFIVLWPDKNKPLPWDLKIFIGNEREKLIEIDFPDYDARYDPKIQWMNEKLIYIRIWWGRILGTDLIFDVEKEAIIYQEDIHDGQTIFQQYQESAKDAEQNKTSGN